MALRRGHGLWIAALFLVGLSLGAAPADLSAQVDVRVAWGDRVGDGWLHGSVGYRSGPDYRDGYRDPRYYRDRAPRMERYRRGDGKVRGGRGKGPPFCRSGQGHPAHGWEWCVRKGFAPAYGSGYRGGRGPWRGPR